MRKGFLFLMAALLVFGACQSKKESTKDIAGHVIIIGLDGWGTWSFEDGDTPFIKEKMKEGSWTLYKRTVRPSISGPNWAAMMNGTPVEVSGITGNEKEPTFKPLVQTEHKAQPTFFHLMRLERPVRVGRFPELRRHHVRQLQKEDRRPFRTSRRYR